MAAHLHDSVLQTLALIQKNAGDGRDGRPAGPRPGARPAVLAVRGRARPTSTRRRRAARRWPPRSRTRHGVVVEVVTVGDCAVRRAACAPSCSAAREAVVNAAKHAGTGKVDVYAEVSPARGRRVRPRPRGRLRPGRRRRRTGTACAAASSTGWSATAARPRSGRRPARAPRCACTCPRLPTTRRAENELTRDRRRAGRSGRDRRRPRDVPGRGPRRARRDRAVEVVARGRRRRRGGRRDRRRSTPRWCCSTCTCPGAAASR